MKSHPHTHSSALSNNTLLRNAFEYSSDVSINYKVYGNGNTPILFLHGFGASLNTWDDIIEFFSPTQYQCYLIDLKGFGFSSKPKDDNYTLEEQANIVIKFIDSLSLRNIILVGHSYGGGVALLTHINIASHNIIKKLVLLDSAAYADNIPFFVKFLRLPLINYLLLFLLPANFLTKYTLKQLFYNKDKVTKAKVFSYSRFLHEKSAKYALVQTAKQIIPAEYHSISNMYRSFNKPTLIIWGKNDPAILLKDGERLHYAIANSHFEIINECGHIPQEEWPGKTFAIIRDFIIEK